MSAADEPVAPLAWARAAVRDPDFPDRFYNGDRFNDPRVEDLAGVAVLLGRAPTGCCIRGWWTG